jgi:succinyl-diaminopimelate desuccinylase
MAIEPDTGPVRTSDVVRLTRRLVKIKSENPPGHTREVCEAVADELREMFQVELLESEPDVVSVLGTREFSDDGPTLILCGHVDVVPVDPSHEGWVQDPWGAETIGGKLYGRGSLDMKGAVAGLITAAKIACEDSSDLCGRLTIAAVADEESGGRLGVGALIDGGKIAGDGVIVAEPGDGGICLAHRGMCFVEITVRGRSTHASMPQNGINAVERMTDVLHALRDTALSYDAHPLLGGPTFSLGTTIQGGTKINVVPDLCRATVDVRKVPGMTDDTVLQDFRVHLEKAGLDDVEFRIVSSGEAAETAPDAEIVRVARAAYEREFGHEPELRGMVAATDGWWFANRAGIPTVMALGPGSIRDTHGVNESVDVVELEAYTRIYTDIIREFLST